MLEKLRNQKEEESRRKSLKIKRQLFGLEVFERAKTVMFYLAFGGEVQTRAMINEAVRLGKKVAVPTCDIKAKRIVPCLLSGLGVLDLKKGPYCIKEPALSRPVGPNDIDLIVMPGLAFDEKGNRLGRGMGYYDRFLSIIPEDTPKIGLAFDFQVLDRLPLSSPHDVRVDKVIFA